MIFIFKLESLSTVFKTHTGQVKREIRLARFHDIDISCQKQLHKEPQQNPENLSHSFSLDKPHDRIIKSACIWCATDSVYNVISTL